MKHAAATDVTPGRPEKSLEPPGLIVAKTLPIFDIFRSPTGLDTRNKTMDFQGYLETSGPSLE